MADSPMLDILTSEGAAVVDADGNQHPSSSSSVAVPSQVIPTPISPGVSSSGTSLPRCGFSFCPQPLPALTPVQLHGTARVIEPSSHQTNRTLEDLDNCMAKISLHETPKLLQLNSMVKAQYLAGNVHAAFREHPQPEDKRQGLPANICSSYNFPILDNAANDTHGRVLEALLKHNSEDVTAHQKQSNDLHISISDRQSVMYKEANVILLKKLLALKNDQDFTHTPDMDAYHKAFEEFERIEKDLSHHKKASLASESNDNDRRKSHLMSGWDRNSDKDAATSAIKSNCGSPVSVTLPTISEGSARPRIAKKPVAGPHDNIGRKAITPPLQFKRRKAGTAGFYSTMPFKSSQSNSPSPSPAGSSCSSAHDHQLGRHIRNTPATPPRVAGSAGGREHGSNVKGKERHHSHGRPASSDGPRPNASDTDSDESQPQPEQSTMKDIPPKFFELMNCILKQQGPQLSSPVRDVEKKRAGPFKDHVSSRKHSPKEIWILKEVHRLCWKYLGIKNGPNIVLNGIGASPEEVAKYETGGPTPPINPMRPDWRSLKSRWNLDLAEAFYIQFCENADNPKEYEFLKNDILVAFENKLKYLRGHVFKATPLRDESSDQTQECLNASLKHRHDISRPTQHRLMLRDVRLEIAGNNMNLGDDRVDLGWRSVYEMLSLLGREGISSDKSDAEGGPYIVKRRTWRSEELTQLLNIIDSSYDRKNIYGNARPGNRPHVRMRCRRATASERAPIRGLPLNFYDCDWYQLLTDVEKQLLHPEPEMELPAFAED
ncbi:hypothetical protein EDD18DRAFT_1344311 [Armillaria luteobubalina]|uniref:Uncharacterized protein n=1 Tax=Armillaria luteobubalina TaxID=153913 RepID=A0AA39QP40_9AGAR|nr:hypothetical protein EDD18DRAFT_1344311 [Armillaria luteobubalina]